MAIVGKVRVKKIVTEGDSCCEHCEHFLYCSNSRAMDLKLSLGGAMREFIGKNAKKMKKTLHIEIECRYGLDRPSKLDLLNIIKELNGHKVSIVDKGLDSYEVFLYSNTELHVISFKNRKSAHYYSRHCYYPRNDYDRGRGIYIGGHFISEGKPLDQHSPNFGRWIFEHDDELTMCFEAIDTGQNPESIK